MKIERKLYSFFKKEKCEKNDKMIMCRQDKNENMTMKLAVCAVCLGSLEWVSKYTNQIIIKNETALPTYLINIIMLINELNKGN